MALLVYKMDVEFLPAILNIDARKAQVLESFKSAGALSHINARSLSLVAGSVDTNLKTPLEETLGKPNIRDSTVWRESLNIVLGFLSKCQMEMTIDTISAELGGARTESADESLPLTLADEIFSGLIHYAKSSGREELSHAVEVFIKEAKRNGKIADILTRDPGTMQ